MLNEKKILFKNNSILYLMKKIWENISYIRKLEVVGLLTLMIFTSFSEIFTIGAVIPFLITLSSPESANKNQIIFFISERIGNINSSDLLLYMTTIFISAALLSGGMRLLLLYLSNKITYLTGGELGLKIYRNTIYQPYLVTLNRNSSEIINGVWYKTNSVTDSIMMVLTIIGSLIMLISILSILIFINPLVTIAAISVFGIGYAVIIRFTRKKLLISGERISKSSSEIIKVIQEGLGSIRDVLLDGSQEVYCATFKAVDTPLRNAQGLRSFIASSPKYVMEAIGIVLISTLAYLLTIRSTGVDQAVPVLGAIALGSQRLLPILHQLYSSYSGLLANKAALKDSVDLLEMPIPNILNDKKTLPIPFEKLITFNNIFYRYTSDGHWILESLNLKIEKGIKLGIVGKSGAGKSTLVDILMGLLESTEGSLEIDGELVDKKNVRAWQMLIAHVPQSIFLADTSVAENIALGVPIGQINMERIKEVSKQAEIDKVIEALPKQYNTIIGERGMRLSGGERQRLGIARALYKQASVIIFDESTSALDIETETAVMKTINGLAKNLTVIVITHRVESLKNCQKIVRIEGGIAIDIDKTEIVA